MNTNDKATKTPWLVCEPYTNRAVFPIGYKLPDGATAIIGEFNSCGGANDECSANARLAVQAVNEHAALNAVAEAAANLAHECVPNSEKNMPRLREFWAAQAALARVRESGVAK